MTPEERKIALRKIEAEFGRSALHVVIERIVEELEGPRPVPLDAGSEDDNLDELFRSLLKEGK